jgi:hypothetical protein
MSAHQMICHLSDGFRVATGMMPVRRLPGPLQRTIVKWIALYVPLSWPAGIRTTPDLDQLLGGTKPGDFTADLAELEALVELVATQQKDDRARLHPIFGTMTQAAWLRWAYLHADHHLRQFGA